MPTGSSQVERVIANGYCIGCGACAAWPNSPFKISMSSVGLYEAVRVSPLSPELGEIIDRLCPFSNGAETEDALANALFPGADQHHPATGRFLAAYAGHVEEGSFRSDGSSGGMGTWLVNELLLTGMADAAVHVVADTTRGADRLFAYTVSTDSAEARRAAKSRYYPVTLVDALEFVRANPRRYVFVGLPCFIKAIRLTARQDPEFAKSVAMCVGLVCGHLKSTGFAECVAWQLGILPGQLYGIDFRKKLPNRPANQYGVEVQGRCDGRVVTKTAPVKQLFGCDWGMGLFKPKACDYCDDVLAETADVSIGDAWLPDYVTDGRGTNILVIRSQSILKLVEAACRSDRLTLRVISGDDVAASQSSGLAHRRQGLACRLSLTDQAGEWRPRKRVAPLSGDPRSPFVRRQQLRTTLRETSHAAFAKAKEGGNLHFFFNQLMPLAERYQDLSRTPLRRIFARFRARVRQFSGYRLR
jgi:coenzyme F420-reducing hydrogenase beta subunit